MSLDALSVSKIRQLRRSYRRGTQKDGLKAVLGDENGNVTVPGEPYNYLVRLANGEDSEGNTQYGRAFPVLSGAGYIGSELIGTGVYIGYTYDNQMSILGPDRSLQVEQGINPRGDNPNSPYRQFIHMYNADLFIAKPMGTQQTHSMIIRVEPSYYTNDSGVMTMFEGGLIDLTSDIPAAVDSEDKHLICAVFVNSGGTLETTVSSTKDIDIDLTWDDAIESFAARSARALPVRFYKLYSGQTLVTESEDFGDAREWITAPKRRNNFAATTAPTVNDDIDLRYEVGSLWIDVTNDLIYRCVNSTDGAAIWKRMATALAETTLIDNGDSPYTILPTDDVLFCDTSAGAITANLPAGTDGQHFVIKNTGANTLTVDPNGSEQLYGAGAGVAQTLSKGENIDIHYSSGLTGWW